MKSSKKKKTGGRRRSRRGRRKAEDENGFIPENSQMPENTNGKVFFSLSLLSIALCALFFKASSSSFAQNLLSDPFRCEKWGFKNKNKAYQLSVVSCIKCIGRERCGFTVIFFFFLFSHSFARFFLFCFVGFVFLFAVFHFTMCSAFIFVT